jgi:hypothetical protein
MNTGSVAPQEIGNSLTKCFGKWGTPQSRRKSHSHSTLVGGGKATRVSARIEEEIRRRRAKGSRDSDDRPRGGRWRKRRAAGRCLKSGASLTRLLRDPRAAQRGENRRAHFGAWHVVAYEQILDRKKETENRAGPLPSRDNAIWGSHRDEGNLCQTTDVCVSWKRCGRIRPASSPLLPSRSWRINHQLICSPR